MTFILVKSHRSLDFFVGVADLQKGANAMVNGPRVQSCLREAPHS